MGDPEAQSRQPKPPVAFSFVCRALEQDAMQLTQTDVAVIYFEIGFVLYCWKAAKNTTTVVVCAYTGPTLEGTFFTFGSDVNDTNAKKAIACVKFVLNCALQSTRHQSSSVPCAPRSFVYPSS